MKHRKRSKSLVKATPISWVGGFFTPGAFVFFAVLALVSSSYAPGQFDALRMRVSDTTLPVVEGLTQPAQDMIASIRDVSGLAKLQADNAALVKENERLKQWYQTAMALNVENESLRSLLKVQPEAGMRYVSARVLTDHDYAFFKSMMVNVGQNDQVHKGHAVVSGEGIVGRIIEVGEDTSRVLLLNDINSRIPVYLQKSGYHAIIAGQNTNVLSIDHLPAESALVDGEYVLTSGKGGAFPLGLPVGRVEIDGDGVASVKPFTDFDRLLHVRILDTQADPNLRPAAL